MKLKGLYMSVTYNHDRGIIEIKGHCILELEIYYKIDINKYTIFVRIPYKYNNSNDNSSLFRFDSLSKLLEFGKLKLFTEEMVLEIEHIILEYI